MSHLALVLLAWPDGCRDVYHSVDSGRWRSWLTRSGIFSLAEAAQVRLPFVCGEGLSSGRGNRVVF